MLSKFNAFFEHEGKDLPAGPILVGVSGGPDSLCLIDLLWRYRSQVIIAHFNHQLRPEADDEAAMVGKLAKKYGSPFVTETQDIALYSKQHGLSLEEAGRKLRYRFLFTQAREMGAALIAVAHHADDQVETILMHFLRGAGLSGLRGMLPVTLLPEFDPEILLVRPLLKTWRSEIDDYCRENQLEPVQDPSNLDQTYFRNRLRHSLIPELETYNPGFKQAVLRSGDSLAGDYQLVKELLDPIWRASVSESGKGYLVFELEMLRAKSPAMLRNLFRRTFYYLVPEGRDVNYEAIERVVRYIQSGSAASTEVDFAHGLFVYKESGKVIISGRPLKTPLPDWPQVTGKLEVKTGLLLKLDEPWSMLVEESDVIPTLAWLKTKDDQFQTWMDADQVHGELWVRPRREGDRFTPLGMPGCTIKLSDFFINEKLLARARKKWPLVCMGEEVIWIPGFRPGHKVRITDSTRRVLHCKLIKSVEPDIRGLKNN